MTHSKAIIFLMIGFFINFIFGLCWKIPIPIGYYSNIKISHYICLKKWVHWPITHLKTIINFFIDFIYIFLACAKNSQVNSKKKILSKYVYFSSNESSGSRYQRRRGPIEISALLKNLTNWIVQTRDLRNAARPILLRKLSLAIQ